jgi:hypothetical protein
MTITMQGGIYITIAYSHEEGNIVQAPHGDNCQNLLSINELNNNFGDGVRLAVGNVTINRDSAVARTWDRVFKELFKNDLFARAEREIGPLGGGSGPEGKASLRGGSSKERAPRGRGLYGGMATVIMGETVVSSMSGVARVEQTGRLEYCPHFTAWARDLEPKYDFPVVKGGAMKLWFRKDGQDSKYA